MAVSKRTGNNQKPGTGQPRQLPGSACEECRKRKLRCDRQRPQCGTCADAGIVCEVNNTRLARGPKRGDLKALRSRIVALERRLSIDVDDGAEPLTVCTGNSPAISTTVGLAPTLTPEGPSPAAVSPCQDSPLWDGDMHVHVAPMTPMSGPLSLSAFHFPSTPPSPPRGNTLVDDLMRADLDQMYFDRVHPNVPIFNQSRYFAKSRQTSCGDAPNYMVCLQYAMWTVAMALSSQFEGLRAMLYSETRQMLEALDLVEDDAHAVPIERVQAWLLLAMYELARAGFHRASISAGRALRLAQLARLHEVDSPASTAEDEDAVAREERRRTFWVAYCLDRLISLRSSCPLTLTEDVICTRLPSPELAFQSGHPIPGCFLPEAMASDDHNFLSPLAQCTLVITMCGRAVSHSHASRVERAFGNTMFDFWLRHEWLESMLSRKLEFMSISTPVPSATADPMVFFAFMMVHAATIFMCQIAETSGMDSHAQLVAEYRSRATRAAREIAGLAKAHEHIGYFKAHIFMPLAVSLGASWLAAERKAPRTGYYSYECGDVGGVGPLAPDAGYQACVDALSKMQSFNHLARDYLAVLETQEFGYGFS